MVSGIQHLERPAFQDSQYRIEDWRSADAGLPRDSGESALRQFREAHGKIALFLAENVHGKMTAGLKGVEGAANTVDGDHYQRWIERKGAERIDR